MLLVRTPLHSGCEHHVSTRVLNKVIENSSLNVLRHWGGGYSSSCSLFVYPRVESLLRGSLPARAFIRGFDSRTQRTDGRTMRATKVSWTDSSTRHGSTAAARTPHSLIVTHCLMLTAKRGPVCLFCLSHVLKRLKCLSKIYICTLCAQLAQKDSEITSKQLQKAPFGIISA